MFLSPIGLQQCVFQYIQLEVSQRPPTAMVTDARQADEEEGDLPKEGFVAETTVGLRKSQLAQTRVDTKRNKVLMLRKS